MDQLNKMHIRVTDCDIHEFYDVGIKKYQLFKMKKKYNNLKMASTNCLNMFLIKLQTE